VSPPARSSHYSPPVQMLALLRLFSVWLACAAIACGGILDLFTALAGEMVLL
jgi:hypothetical protein